MQYKHELYLPGTVSLDAQDGVYRILKESYDGYTLNAATGYWKGSVEDVTIITIYSQEYSIKRIAEIIQIMKDDGEEAVLTTCQEMDSVHIV